MSYHFAIFKRVCVTFIKSILLYSVVVFAFAMSFITLFGYKTDNIKDRSTLEHCEQSDSDYCNEHFSTLLPTLVTTVRMMLADFDAGKVELDKDTFMGIIFLLFVFFITLVLFSLLNALAVSDTQDIKLQAELIDTRKKISVMHGYEKVFAIFRISWFSVLRHVVPHANIVLFPNRTKNVYTKELLGSEEKNVNFDLHKSSNLTKYKLITRKNLLCIKIPYFITRKVLNSIIATIENRKDKNIEG
jgi:hypothetical protein